MQRVVLLKKTKNQSFCRLYLFVSKIGKKNPKNVFQLKSKLNITKLTLNANIIFIQIFKIYNKRIVKQLKIFQMKIFILNKIDEIFKLYLKKKDKKTLIKNITTNLQLTI